MFQRSEDLIREKEKNGATVSTYGKILLFIIMIVMQMINIHDHAEIMHIFVILIPCTVILSVSAYYLSKNRGVRITGYISLAIDITIIAVIPFIWYDSENSGALPRTYLLKTALPYVIFSLLAVNTLALKPAYPLILSIASGFYMTGLFFYAAMGPGFTLSDNISETILGPSINLFLYFSTVIVILLCGITLSFIALTARRTIIKSAQNEVKNSQLSRYFSPDVAELIMKEDSELSLLAGKKQDVAVMFSDIRDFTMLCETHATEEILTLLSEYHRFMVSIIFEFNGTLDKFIGDGILATFGTPNSSGNDAENAVLAALKIRRALIEFNETRSKRGAFTIHHGLGIDYGPVIVGNIGSEDRLEYTVVGDTVNMASRIESSCKTVNEDILISEAVALKLNKQLTIKPYAHISIKGKTGEYRLYGLG